MPSVEENVCGRCWPLPVVRPLEEYPAGGTLGSGPEMIHAYSLVHDDLPCMDDDDYRRGKLTCHKVFGEGLAVLTGDALLTQGFYLFPLADVGVDGDTITRVLAELGQACGTDGLIGGRL